MEYKFKAFGHPNMLGTHKNTLEFTKDKDLTLKGDCIIGVNSDYDLKEIQKFLDKKQISLELECNNETDYFTANPNIEFNDEHEMVFRKSEFLSERTLGLRSEKGAIDINRKIIEHLKDKNNILNITIKSLN